MSGQSMREALEGAFDASEDEEGTGGTEETGGSVEDTKEPLGAADEQKAPEGKEEVVDDKKESQVKADDDVDGKSEATKDSAEEVKDKDTGELEVKAPASWKPGAREEWSNIPVAAQREIARREKHMDHMIRESADSRKLQTEFGALIHPFEPLIAAQNSTPMVAIKNLMTTAAGLTLGAPQQKAQIVSNIMKEYGVDVAELDAILSGQPVVSQEQTGVQEMLARELAPIKNFMGQLNTQQQSYASSQQVTMETEIETFANDPANEFFVDVKDDMADLMEMSANRNKSMTISEAYAAACRMHPEISGIIGKRSVADTAKANNEAIGKKRLAASSIHGTQVGDGKQASGDTLRSAITDAIEELS